jgi:hypothetical protein
MKYLLVLQFPADSIADYDELIEIEDLLISELAGSAKVDGHDSGSGEMNIFILTGDPSETFEAIKPHLAKRKSFKNLVAAYRETKDEEFTTLWPAGYRKPFKIK